MASGPETRTQAARHAAGTAEPPAPAPPGPTLADLAAKLASMQMNLDSQAATIAAQASQAATHSAELADLKRDHANEFTIMQRLLDDANRRAADADGEPEADIHVLYTPHFREENPFHPRPPTVTLEPQVYPMYGNPTYDALKRRGKDSESELREHVTLTAALSRIFDILHSMEVTRDEFTDVIDTHCGGEKANAYEADLATIRGVYDLLHHRHALQTLITAYEENPGGMTAADAGRIAYLQQILYGASGPDAKSFTANSKVAKGLRTFYNKHTYAVLNAGAKSALTPNTSNSSTPSNQTLQQDAAQAKARRERQAANAKKKRNAQAAGPPAGEP